MNACIRTIAKKEYIIHLTSLKLNNALKGALACLQTTILLLKKTTYIKKR